MTLRGAGLTQQSLHHWKEQLVMTFSSLSSSQWVAVGAQTKWTGLDIARLWTRGTQLVLSLLILTLLVALLGGVAKTFYELHLLLTLPVAAALRHVIVDTLILLAVVEVLRTTLTYLSEGRVKVTYIVDTILVVMLTEIISEWFQGAEPGRWYLLGGILATLAAIRIVAVLFSPPTSLVHDTLEETVHLGV